MNISQSNKEALKNPWVLGMLLFLVTFVTANAIFIYLAFQSAPQLVVEDFYERGEQYVETQKLIEKQKALGWTGVIMAPKTTRVNQHQLYEVLIQGKHSAALILDSVILHAYRPSDARADFSVEMQTSKPGMYGADVSFNLPGIWDVIIVAKQGEHEFMVTKRFTISP
ncbi:MAG: FixH family protein [Pseudomonadota bacterium]|nr:FixH family protein [Pseudomonadota bacterium]MDO7667919.1 FixH family protein [Pseudomonadota bacterium]MDO7711942.1 FixH family protein [Pseudomonadota bacterium]